MNTPFLPVDPDCPPRLGYILIEVQFQDGTTAYGHFSPENTHTAFWEYKGVEVINGLRQRTHAQRKDFATHYRELPQETQARLWEWDLVLV